MTLRSIADKVRQLSKSNGFLLTLSIVTACLWLWPHSLHWTNVYLDRFVRYWDVKIFFVALCLMVGLNRIGDRVRSAAIKKLLLGLSVLTWIPLVISGCMSLLIVSESEIDELYRFPLATYDGEIYCVSTHRRSALDDLDLYYFRERPVAPFLKYRESITPGQLDSMGFDTVKVVTDYRTWYVNQ